MTWPWWQRVRDRRVRGEGPPLERVDSPDEPVGAGWRAELLAETDRTWKASCEAAESLCPWVPPILWLPRCAFRAHGYEPGERPPHIPAMRALFEAMYHPSVAPLPKRVWRHPELRRALSTWVPGDPENRARAHLVFRELSELLGEALGFEPAPLEELGPLQRNAQGEYSDTKQVVRLSSTLLGRGPACFVNVLVHEQLHHQQNLLMERLIQDPDGMSPAERSLALFWSERCTPSPLLSFLAYRLSGREVHSWEMARTVEIALSRVFGWGAWAPRR